MIEGRTGSRPQNSGSARSGLEPSPSLVQGPSRALQAQLTALETPKLDAAELRSRHSAAVEVLNLAEGWIRNRKIEQHIEQLRLPTNNAVLQRCTYDAKGQQENLAVKFIDRSFIENFRPVIELSAALRLEIGVEPPPGGDPHGMDPEGGYHYSILPIPDEWLERSICPWKNRS